MFIHVLPLKCHNGMAKPCSRCEMVYFYFHQQSVEPLSVLSSHTMMFLFQQCKTFDHLLLLQLFDLFCTYGYSCLPTPNCHTCTRNHHHRNNHRHHDDEKLIFIHCFHSITRRTTATTKRNATATPYEKKNPRKNHS